MASIQGMVRTPGSSWAMTGSNSESFEPTVPAIARPDARDCSDESSFDVSSVSSKDSNHAAPPAVQHLLRQNKFLRDELQRLESLLSEAQNAAPLSGSEAAAQRLKDRDIGERLRSTQELEERCASLDERLQAALSSRSTLTTEKINLMNKVKRLENIVKAQKGATEEARVAGFEEKDALSITIEKQKSQITEMNKEYTKMRKLLNAKCKEIEQLKAEHTSSTASDNAVNLKSQKNSSFRGSATVACQVEPLFDENVSGLDSQSLALILQARNTELCNTRTDLQRLIEIHQATVQKLDITQSQVEAAVQQAKQAQNDLSRSNAQLAFAQQQNAEFTRRAREQEVIQLESEARMATVQERMQALQNECLNRDATIASMKTEIDEANARARTVEIQLSKVQRESDEFRGDFRRLILWKKEATIALESKERQLEEVLQIHQSVVGDITARMEEFQGREAEIVGLRRTLHQKEEELRGAHARAEVLTEQILSLQRVATASKEVEFDNRTLNTQLQTTEMSRQQLSDEVLALARDHMVQKKSKEELERDTKELNKELIERDEECRQWRTRCQELEEKLTAAEAFGELPLAVKDEIDALRANLQESEEARDKLESLVRKQAETLEELAS